MTTYEKLLKKVDKLDEELDALEDNGYDETSSEWRNAWKLQVQIKAQMYKLAFPESTIVIADDKMSFRSVR